MISLSLYMAKLIPPCVVRYKVACHQKFLPLFLVLSEDLEINVQYILLGYCDVDDDYAWYEGWYRR